jgi:hypothetical protein
MSFADHRNVDNAMDESPHSTVILDNNANDAIAHVRPLLATQSFDFENYKYKSLSLMQHTLLYARMKVSASKHC